MRRPLFSPAELAEMAAADAEIEKEFRLTQEEIVSSRRRDRNAQIESMSDKKRKLAAQQKAYREANRDKVAAQQKAWYEANRDKVAAQQKAYREANRDKVAAQQKAYREANRDKLAAQQKAYREANRDNQENSELRDALRYILKENGYTQEVFSKMIGTCRSTVGCWLSGFNPVNVELVRTVFPTFPDI